MSLASTPCTSTSSTRRPRPRRRRRRARRTRARPGRRRRSPRRCRARRRRRAGGGRSRRSSGSWRKPTSTRRSAAAWASRSRVRMISSGPPSSERGEREDLVGVEGPVVGGGVHRAILGGRIQRAMDNVELVIFFLLIAVAALRPRWRACSTCPTRSCSWWAGASSGSRPGVPDVELDPDLVLLIFLPPLLFNLAYFSSLRDLRARMRADRANAVGLVLLTTVLVAVAAHAAIPGMPWAAAFALGAIVSPTDPLAATAILRRLGVPRRLTSTHRGREPDQRRHGAGRLPHGGRGRGRRHVRPAARDGRLRRQRGRGHRGRRRGRRRAGAGAAARRRRRHRRRGDLARRRLHRPTCRPSTSASPACSPR